MAIVNKKYGIKEYVKLGFQGFCMGIAHIIPGVSGGTIAFIFGIYEELIQAIHSLDMKLMRLVLSLKIREALGYVPWQMLGGLFIGMLTAIFSLSKLMHWLLVHQPVYVNSFFFGLILATIPIIAGALKKWSPRYIALGVIMTIVMYYFVGMVPMNTPNSLLFLFFCGAIAICTMILPGVSGSFVLLLLGKYQYIISAVSNREWGTLFTVAFGCVVGILLFVRFLNWVLKNYHDQTMVILTGLVIGSLRKIWPWKETLSTLTTSKGKIVPIEQINILPSQMSQEVVFAFVLCVAGFGMAMLLSLSENKKGN